MALSSFLRDCRQPCTARWIYENFHSTCNNAKLFSKVGCIMDLMSVYTGNQNLQSQWALTKSVNLLPFFLSEIMNENFQHITEYVLIKTFTNETLINADLNDLRHGAFAGNYSSLSFTVVLVRQMGFYLIDYFLPSMMIVSISWVSFWLQADQTAPRVMLGCTTMLVRFF